MRKPAPVVWDRCLQRTVSSSEASPRSNVVPIRGQEPSRSAHRTAVFQRKRRHNAAGCPPLRVRLCSPVGGTSTKRDRRCAARAPPQHGGDPLRRLRSSGGEWWLRRSRTRIARRIVWRVAGDMPSRSQAGEHVIDRPRCGWQARPRILATWPYWRTSDLLLERTRPRRPAGMELRHQFRVSGSPGQIERESRSE